MIRRFTIVAVLLVSIPVFSPYLNKNTNAAYAAAAPATGTCRRVPTRKYHIQLEVDLTKKALLLDKVVVVLPLPQSNEYQDVQNVRIGGKGKILKTPDSEDKYVQYIQTEKDLVNNRTKKLTLDCDVQLYDLVTDLGRIKEFYPYDRTKPDYRRYTGKTGVYLDPAEPRIAAISKDLWGQAKNPLDYARRCYDYITRDYIAGLKQGTGLHPLAQILDDGGGDCGNLSSIFISLMRCRGIPARHVITVGAVYSYHVWAEFYLEGYGWLPVDVAQHMGYGYDYFGRFESRRMYFGQSDWVVVSKTTDASYDFVKLKSEMPILQTFGICIFNAIGNIKYEYKVNARLVK